MKECVPAYLCTNVSTYVHSYIHACMDACPCLCAYPRRYVHAHLTHPHAALLYITYIALTTFHFSTFLDLILHEITYVAMYTVRRYSISMPDGVSRPWLWSFRLSARIRFLRICEENLSAMKAFMIRRQWQHQIGKKDFSIFAKKQRLSFVNQRAVVLGSKKTSKNVLCSHATQFQGWWHLLACNNLRWPSCSHSAVSQKLSCLFVHLVQTHYRGKCVHKHGHQCKWPSNGACTNY